MNFLDRETAGKPSAEYGVFLVSRNLTIKSTAFVGYAGGGSCVLGNNLAFLL